MLMSRNKFRRLSKTGLGNVLASCSFSSINNARRCNSILSALRLYILEDISGAVDNGGLNPVFVKASIALNLQIVYGD